MPENEKVVKVNYATGNSHRLRDEKDEKPMVLNGTPEKTEEKTETPRVKKLEGVNGTVRKKTLGRKIADTFNGDDTKSVGEYVIFEVLLPNAKELVVDVAIQAIERKILGTSGPRRGGGSRGGGPINYNSISKAATRLSSQGESLREKATARTGRNTQEFEDIFFDTRGEAEEALEQMRNVIEDYGVVRVADLQQMVGVTGPFTANSYGWDNLNSVAVRHYRGAYFLDLPRPIQIS